MKTSDLKYKKLIYTVMKRTHFLLLALLLIGAIACKSDNDIVLDVTLFKEQLNRINEDINSMSILANALDNNILVANITQEGDGCQISFADGKKITVKNGTSINEVPLVGIGKWKGGYCWTLTSGGVKTYLTDEKGNNNRANRTIPNLKIMEKEGCWAISYDKGITYIPLLDKNGNTIQVIDNGKIDNNISLFKSVTVEDDVLSLILADGTVLKMSIVNKGNATMLINGTVRIEESDGLFVASPLAEEVLSENGFNIEVFNDSIPQLIYITDSSDQILMMARGFFQNQPLEINATTSALAFISLMPPFLSVANKNFNELTTTIANSANFPIIVSEMSRIIAEKKDIFSTENTTLFAAVGQLIENICVPNQTRSVVTGIDNHHLDVRAIGKTVSIRNTGLKPPYECQVFYSNSRIADEIIPSASSHGILDILSQNMGANHYGEPIDFVLTDEGSYYFVFEKYTERAILALSWTLMSDLWGILGAGYSDLELNGLINNGLVATHGFDFQSYISSVYAGITPPDGWNFIREVLISLLKNEGVSWVEKVFGSAVDEFVEGTNFYKQLKKIGALNLEKATKVISKLIVVYDVLKGIGNNYTRIFQAYRAEPSIDFHLCSYNIGGVTCCTETELKIVSGNNQSGLSGETLKLPLTVSVKTIADDGTEIMFGDYHVVRFQVVSGGGYVGERNVKNVDIDPVTKTASIDWSLGKHGEQLVRAVVYDRITEKDISEPVYFKASLNNKIITGSANNITKNSVTLSGRVIGYDITGTDMYGICYSTTPSFVNKVIVPAHNILDGNFSVNIGKLIAGQTYYWRAYVKCDNDYEYGDIQTFTTEKDPDTVDGYLGDGFNVGLMRIHKISQKTGSYRMYFNVSGFAPKEEVVSYIECTCFPSGYQQYAQVKSVMIKKGGETYIDFDNLYAGTNELSLKVFVEKNTDKIYEDYGTKSFYVNWKTLKDVKVEYVGDEISNVYNTGIEWRNKYKITYFFEDNPLVIGNSSKYNGHLGIEGITGYSRRIVGTDPEANTETHMIGISETQYDIDWTRYHAQLKESKVFFTYYEYNNTGDVYGQDDVEIASDIFDYNETPTIKITGLGRPNRTSDTLVDWGTGGFGGSSKGSDVIYWDCTGRLFLRFASIECVNTLPVGAIEHKETTIAGQLSSDGKHPMQSTSLSMFFRQNITYDGTLILKATFSRGGIMESSNYVRIYQSSYNSVEWSIISGNNP